MRSSFFVTASVLSSMLIAMALVSAVVSHAAQVHPAMLDSVRVIQS